MRSSRLAFYQPSTVNLHMFTILQSPSGSVAGFRTRASSYCLAAGCFNHGVPGEAAVCGGVPPWAQVPWGQWDLAEEAGQARPPRRTRGLPFTPWNVTKKIPVWFWQWDPAQTACMVYKEHQQIGLYCTLYSVRVQYTLYKHMETQRATVQNFCFDQKLSNLFTI